jgi:hypothetical protein
MLDTRGGVDAGSPAVDLGLQTRRLACAGRANFSGRTRRADRAVAPRPALSRRAAKGIARRRIDAGSAAVDFCARARGLTSTGIANLSRGTNRPRRSNTQSTAPRCGATERIARRRIYAVSAAVDLRAWTRNLAGPRVAHLARATDGPGGPDGTVAPGRRTAIREVRLRVDACSTAVDEAGLAAERASSAGANIPGCAYHSRAPVACNPAVAACAAIGRVGRRIDASAVAINEAGLATERAGATVADLAVRTGHPSAALAIRTTSADGTAIRPIRAGVDAPSVAVHQTGLATQLATPGRADAPGWTCGPSAALGIAAAPVGSPAIRLVGRRVDAGAVANHKSSLTSGLADAAEARGARTASGAY